MYGRLGKVSARQRAKRRSASLTFGPWPRGLLIDRQAEQAKKSDLLEALNMVLIEEGIARTRDGSALVCSGCTGKITQAEIVTVGGEWMIILVDSDNKLYRQDGAGVQLIQEFASGPVRFLSYMEGLLIFDGQGPKFWDGRSIRICFDDGVGDVGPYQFSNRFEADTKSIAIRAGEPHSIPFTSADWSAGYGIPPTVFFARMRKVGSPAGPVKILVKLAGAHIAAGDLSVPAEKFVTDETGSEYEVLFDEGGVVMDEDRIMLDTDLMTEYMMPNTDYVIEIDFPTGDADNYVELRLTDKDEPVTALRPGPPPKAHFGAISKGKAFTVDLANPGEINYCAAGNPFDWSTPNGGGKMGAVDDSASNFPVGAVVEFFGVLYIYGTSKQPYLARLLGDTPADYRIQKIVDNISADQKSIVVSPDNIWFLHPTGVDSVKAVQEHGDIAVSTQTDSVKDVIHKYFSHGAVAGYDPAWGLYCLKMEGTDDIFVVHTRLKSARAQGQRAVGFSPVTRWRYKFPDPVSCFGSGDGCMLVGTEGGELYAMDKGASQDNEIDPDYKIMSYAQVIPFGEGEVERVSVTASGRFGGSFNMAFYRDYQRDALVKLPFDVPMDSGILTAEADMDTAEAMFLTNPAYTVDRGEVNFNFRSLQVGIEDIKLSGKPLYIGSIRVRAAQIGGF